jgi:hypothetical protein
VLQVDGRAGNLSNICLLLGVVAFLLFPHHLPVVSLDVSHRVQLEVDLSCEVEAFEGREIGRGAQFEHVNQETHLDRQKEGLWSDYLRWGFNGIGLSLELYLEVCSYHCVKGSSEVFLALFASFDSVCHSLKPDPLDSLKVSDL